MPVLYLRYVCESKPLYFLVNNPVQSSIPSQLVLPKGKAVGSRSKPTLEGWNNDYSFGQYLAMATLLVITWVSCLTFGIWDQHSCAQLLSLLNLILLVPYYNYEIALKGNEKVRRHNTTYFFSRGRLGQLWNILPVLLHRFRLVGELIGALDSKVVTYSSGSDLKLFACTFVSYFCLSPRDVDHISITFGFNVLYFSYSFVIK